ncbi:hypothetical protein [Geobacillus kaustophilus]|uniref:hypothetical protein n=1 Tax=Geobacillus kaustophilus TaxID=1462 RepID=UPI0005CD4C44|nr:hypothetical protein [Geobacillus kaustophilus]
MSELLTTGQMIDRLKPGEVAESKNRKAYYDSNCQLIEESKATGEKRPFTIWSGGKSPIWRILPRYVTFDRAMKALAEGKTVWAWVDGEKRLCYWIDQESGKLWGMSAEGGMTTVHNIGFFKEWTIEE